MNDLENENTQNENNPTEDESKRIHSVNPEYVFDGYEKSQETKSEELKDDVRVDRFQQHEDRFSYPGGYQIPESNPKKKSGSMQAVIGLLLSLGVFVFLVGGLWLASNFLGGANDNTPTPSKPNGQVAIVDTKPATENSTESSSKNNVTMTNGQIGTTGNVTATLLDVSPVVENVFSSVVAVTNTTIYKPIYNSWFGQSDQKASGAGSGVIVAKNDTELLIVSNAHVVIPENYQNYSVSSCELKVTFANDVEAEATLKGYDSDMDLAVLAVDLSKIDEETMKEIKIASIGDSDQIKVGNGVIAIGNALGFGLSVTVGYVSALNREITFSDGTTRTLLQTDAAINPGNSGGGLFDLYGNLVAINSAKYSDESVEGIGYAIPISTAREKIEELMNREPRKKVTDEDKKCAIGVGVENVYLQAYDGKGAFISTVTEGGPAEKAGLMPYDIITKINDVEIKTWDELKEELSYYEGGTTIEVTYLSLETNRKYKEKTTNLTLGYAKDILKTE